jgi:hypothetical protein
VNLSGKESEVKKVKHEIFLLIREHDILLTNCVSLSVSGNSEHLTIVVSGFVKLIQQFWRGQVKKKMLDPFFFVK